MKQWLAGLILMASSTLSAEVAPDAFSIRPLMAGAEAPAFEAASATGDTFEFDPGNLARPALLIFYRGGWCPYCNLHWAELRKIEDELLALDLDLIFLSADRPAILAEAVQDGEPAYHLLSDASMRIAESFGIAFKVDEATVRRYLAEHDIDLEAASGYDHHVLPAPAVFLVDTDGVIKFQYVNPDYKVRISPELLLAAARTMPGRQLRKP